MIKLFVVGFPRDMDEFELVELFSAHGGVDAVKIVTDKDTHESKGYGFITMTDQLSANRAIEAINGLSIQNRTISVRLAEDKQSKERSEERLIVKPKSYNQERSGGQNRGSNPEIRKKRPRRPNS
jgi:RNA recognition motif-containing protein